MIKKKNENAASCRMSYKAKPKFPESYSKELRLYYIYVCLIPFSVFAFIGIFQNTEIGIVARLGDALFLQCL